MESIVQVVKEMNGILWGPLALVFLSGVAIYLTIGTRGVHLRYFFRILKETLLASFSRSETGDASVDEDKGTISNAQSLFTALASTIGMGSIVGVASALIMGGPGAILWMWVASFLGMIIKYSEIILMILYRRKDAEGSYVSGPAYYIREGLGQKWLAIVIVVFLILAALSSNMIQSNVVVQNMTAVLPFELSNILLSLILVVLIALVLFGGIKRIGTITEKVVPAMSMIYLFAGLFVIVSNYQNILPALQAMMKGFYSPVALGGGVVGYGILKASQYGIARGFFVSGAGQAMFTVSHAPATVDHPVEQAVYGITEIFLVTIICTITALSILTSGVFTPEADAGILTTLAFNETLPGLGYFVSISIILFSFTTVLGLGYIVQSQIATIRPSASNQWILVLYLVCTFIGGMNELGAMWELTDFFLAVVMYINLVAMLLLSKEIFKSSNDYWKRKN